MIALFASLLGFGSGAGLSTNIASANGPGGCPLCCGRSSVAGATNIAPQLLSVKKETAVPWSRGRTCSPQKIS